MLGKAKKTDSHVDPLPHLIRNHPASFAHPITQIFNAVSKDSAWPRKHSPTDLSKCRNISCDENPTLIATQIQVKFSSL